ncbi:succinate dehydrogenase assembly factor 2 [Palleronia sediminis]|uniref:FAD assembly factor SdhE n=1 Tax=Palleronia sediminis TaxID=2547833 RepID=A0A4V3BA61_9RHOB|nr:succinate dehydrogenase assembly factor 2 [Palleronia sediminis]TDL81819.1 succinate dehydrogenase assembly factor 2 [Palleronia sediminis]
MTTEDPDIRLRRLRMRSSRRGIKEMDLILGAFAAGPLTTLEDEELAAYELMLSENDQDLYRWVSGQEDPPARFAPLIDRIRAEIVAAQGVARP